MNVKSHLIQETVNNILETLVDFRDETTVLLKDNTLAKKLNVSRTTIRTALIELERKGVVEIDGSHKKVLRSPKKDDFF